jgi:hypothetical protein
VRHGLNRQGTVSVARDRRTPGEDEGHGDLTVRGTWTGHRVARGLVVAGLAVDVYVHWHLATRLDPVRSSVSPHLTEGQLFRAEAAVALVAAVLVVVVPRWWSAALALAVAAGGVAAVLVYSLVDLGAVGPMPDMYDPSWYGEKTLSLVGEAVAAAAAMWWVVAAARRPRDG